MALRIRTIGELRRRSLAVSVAVGLFAAFGHSSVFAASDNIDPTCGDWSPSGTVWSSGNVTFTLSDSTDAWWSGIDVSGGSCTAYGDGDDCTVTIRDRAWNTTACRSPQARIDDIDPVCGSWNPPTQGWGKTSIAFTLSSSRDNESGISVAGGSCTVTTDGGNCQVTIRDRAGNTRVCVSPNGRIDNTPPVCEGWFIKSPPSTSFTQWNGQYDEWSIPWTQQQKTIYVTGNDTGGSGMSSTQYLCDETSNSVSIAFCTATITDKAGNSTDCWGPNLSPRVRQDATPPPKPTLNCTLIDTNEPWKYECRITTAPDGPSPTMVYYKVGTNSWNFNGRYWFLSQNGSFVPQDTQSLVFPLNVTPGTSVTVYAKFEETGGDSVSDAYTFTASSAVPVDPPVSSNPNPVVTGSQVFSYVEDTSDWYTCWGSLSWPVLSESRWSWSRSSTTYCSSDGDGWSYPSWGPWTVGNGGSRACLCRDAYPPIVNTITASTSGWTKNAVSFSTTVSDATRDGSAYRWIWYGCQGQALTYLAGATSVSFTCSGDAATAQTATIKSCDTLQCTQRTITYYKETTPPSGTLTINGKIGNHDGETTVWDTSSTQYTKTPVTTLSYSASDTGGSGLDVNPVKFSCSSDPNGVWTWETLWAGSRVFNITTGAGCAAWEGMKTVYMHIRDVAGNVSTVSNSIRFDTSNPTFAKEAKILLLARGGYAYTVQGASDPGSSGIRDYSIAWFENGDLLDQSMNSASSSKNFGDIARYINENDADGKREATIKITLEDNAGNVFTDSVPVTIIAAMASFDSDSSVLPSRTPAVADLADSYDYRVKLKDTNGNIIRPVTGIRKVGTIWEFDNTSTFLWNNNFTDGSIYYNWDGNGFSSNVGGNSFHANYDNSTQKVDGIYTIGVRSAVPTAQGYANYTNNQIRLSTLRFENVLESTLSDVNGCPTGYVCTGTNANPTFTRTISVDLANETGMKDYIAFKPAVEITPQKNFNVLTDNAWYPIKLVFKNNSVNRSFSLDDYRFAFHYSNDLGPFADIRIRGDLGEHTEYPDAFKKVPFVFENGFPALAASATATKNIEIQTNSYGYGFGKFGFSAFLPYDGADNNIGGLSDTGYNTENLWLLAGVTGYENVAATVPTGSFGEGVAEGQKIAVRGAIADNGNNAFTATLESGVKIDAEAIDRQKLKTKVQQNAYDMTRGMTPKNGTDCTPTLNSVASEDVYFYDFSKLTNSTPINGNPGCYLTILWQGVTGGANYRVLPITGKKTIIIKGGNAYLDSDAYYADSNSMLAIIVLRDDVNRKKGGNLLINPMVTNVAAAGYVEGSVMSYDGNKTYEKDNTHEGELTRQLHWYGSVYSSNTIGGSLASGTTWKCPYGSDTYEASGSEACSQSEASKYDFVAMRRFVLINATSGSCVNGSKKAAKSSGTSGETYAMAGKPMCYADDPTSIAGLRKTTEKAPFVIEYNPMMQSSGMRVFSAKQ